MIHRRIRTAIQAEFETGALRGRGKIRNMAEGGLFVGTAVVPQQGEPVSLSFRDHRAGGWTSTASSGGPRATNPESIAAPASVCACSKTPNGIVSFSRTWAEAFAAIAGVIQSL